MDRSSAPDATTRMETRAPMVRLLVTCRSKRFESGQDVSRQLWTLDPDLCLIHPDETPLDLMLEVVALSRAASWLDDDRLAGQGYAHVRHAVGPGAVRRRSLPAAMALPDTLARLLLDEETATATLPDGSTLALEAFLKVGAERIDTLQDHRTAPKALATGLSSHRKYDASDRWLPAATGFAIGLADGLLPFAAENRLAWGIRAAGLVAMLAAPELAAITARPGRWQRPSAGHEVMDGVREILEMIENFNRHGVLVSDRGYAPRRILRGPRFDEVLDAVPPPMLALGRRAGAALAPMPAVSEADLGHLLAALGIDPGPHVAIRDFASSAHERIASRRLFLPLIEAIGLDPDAASPHLAA